MKKYAFIFGVIVFALGFLFLGNIQGVLAVCGDGILEVDQGEMCDQGLQNGDTKPCSSTCQRTYCGDSTVQTPNSLGLIELCDDGNDNADDGCNNDCCFFETCGNGTKDTGEACDDGNGVDGDGCSSRCEVEVVEAPTPTPVSEPQVYSSPQSGSGGTLVIYIAVGAALVAGVGFYIMSKKRKNN